MYLCPLNAGFFCDNNGNDNHSCYNVVAAGPVVPAKLVLQQLAAVIKKVPCAGEMD